MVVLLVRGAGAMRPACGKEMPAVRTGAVPREGAERRAVLGPSNEHYSFSTPCEASELIDCDVTPCRHPRESGYPAWVPAFAGMTAGVAVRALDDFIIPASGP